MPYPIKNGRNFSITYLNAPANYRMSTMCASYDFYEIGFMIQGERKSITPDGVYFFHPGSVVLTPPGLMHQTVSVGNEPYSRILIKVSTSVIDKIRTQLGSDLFDNLCAEHVLSFQPEGLEQIHTLFSQMLEEYESYADYTDALLSGMLLRLLVLINRWKRRSSHPILNVEVYNETIIRALRYIEFHAEDDLSLKRLADYVGLAPAYFSRLFKKVTGTTYSDYVNKLRLLYARNLLMQTKLTINEIALASGFGNGNYLSNVFHKYFYMTPTQYKKKYANSESYPDFLLLRNNSV